MLDNQVIQHTYNDTYSSAPIITKHVIRKKHHRPPRHVMPTQEQGIKTVAHRSFAANVGSSLQNKMLEMENRRVKSASSSRENLLNKPKEHPIKSDRTDTQKRQWKQKCLEYDSLLKHQDSQIEQLKCKLNTLHEYNEQFAQENVVLKSHIDSIVTTQSQKDVSDNAAGCEGCTVLQQDMEKCTNMLSEYKIENEKMKDDLTMMKTLVYRLNVQLERYQEKVRSLSKDSNQLLLKDSYTKLDSNNKEPLKWGSVSNHTLAPLLNALTQSITEKSELVQNYEETMCEFTGHLKDIIAENENLQANMENVTSLQSQVRIWKGRTEILVKKNDLIKDKLTQVLSCYENKVQTMTLDYNTLYEQYSAVRKELANREHTVSGVTTDHKECNEKVETYRKLFDQLKLQYEADSTRLNSEISNFKAQISDNEAKVLALTLENTQLKEQNESSRKLTEKYMTKIKLVQKRLEKALSWGQVLQKGQDALKTSQQNAWRDMNDMEKLIHKKEKEVLTLQQRHAMELSKLYSDLQQKDKILNELMENYHRHRSQCASLQNLHEGSDKTRSHTKHKSVTSDRVRFARDSKSEKDDGAKITNENKSKLYLNGTNIKRPDYFLYGDRVLSGF